MLARQQGGRHDHSDLLASHGNRKGRTQGHLGLAKADIAADQPVHGPAQAQVIDHRIDGVELVVGLVMTMIVSLGALTQTVVELELSGYFAKRRNRRMIDKFVKSTAREVSIDYIQKVVCDYFDLAIDTMKSKTRKREVVQARQIAMYFAKSMTKSSLATIGMHCGGKDHATVLHACRTVTNLSETDKQFKVYLADLEKKLSIQ
jgi:hypothetical protein